MSGNTTTDRLATRDERESEMISLIKQSDQPELVDHDTPTIDMVDAVDGGTAQPSGGSPELTDSFETVMEQPGTGYTEVESTHAQDTDGQAGSRPEADPYLTITMENNIQQGGAGGGAAGATAHHTSGQADGGSGAAAMAASRIDGAADGSVVRESGLDITGGVEQADMDAIAERQERREAIEDAHAAGDAYYDGTTTIDGVEVQIWLMPDGSTVYLDPETETVVDLTWESSDAKDAARDAAHEADQPFFEGTTEIDGEIVEVWEMPDGSTAYVAVDDREVVGFEWPEGEEPEYQGQVSIDGESHSLIELPNGDQVVVDADGDFVGYLDDVELDTVTYPHPTGEVYAVPQGPPGYDTTYYSVETGEPAMAGDTGTTDPAGMFTYYAPPGEDYVLVIDSDGNIVDAFELPPDEEWSVLGIVSYYDDGSVVVDVGAGEITVDLGAEGGIWFSSDGLGELIEGADWVGSVEAGVAWDEEGIDVDVSADVAGVGELGYGFSVGEDGFDMYVDAALDLELNGQGVAFDVHGEVGLTSDGTLYAGADVEMNMTVPAGFDIGLDVNAYVEVGPDGFEGTYGWDGTVGMLGAYVSGGEQYSIDIDSDGVTGTYEYYRGAGIQGVGEVRAGGEAQVHTDGTLGGSSVTGGIYGSTHDKDGDETGMTGVYSTLDEDGVSTPEVRNEHLDTGVTKEDYDRHGDPDLPEDTVTGLTGVEWRDDSTSGIGEVPRGDDTEDDGDTDTDTGGGVTERARIWQRRDGDATDPADEPAPTPTGERRPLFGDEPADEPAPEPPTDGPTNRPPIFAERLQDVDEDGDGRPDRLGRDPILGDGDGDLGDIADGPPVLRGQDQTASAAPPPPSPETMDPVEVDPVTTAASRDQAPAGVERPESEPVTADAGAEQAPGDLERPDLEPDSVVMSGGSTMARGDLLDDDITAVRATTPAAPQPEPQVSTIVQRVEPAPEPEPVIEPVLEQPTEPVVEPVVAPIEVVEPVIEPVIELVIEPEPEPTPAHEPEPIVEPEPDLLDDQG